MDCQMKRRVLNRLQSRQHGLLVPDGPLLGVDFRGFPGQWRFADQIPFDRIREGGFQEGVNLADGRAGQQPFLLGGSQFLFFAVDILAARGLAQGGVELLDVKGAEILNLPLADIRRDQVVHHRSGLGVGFGRPLVLARLNRNPFFQQFLNRHGIGDQEGAILQFLFNRDFSFGGFLLGLEGLPAFMFFASVVNIGVSDGISASALHNGCHG